MSAQAGFTTQPKTGNASAALPVASHLRPFRARANPGEAASINSNHRPRHQVKPHRRPLQLCVAPQTLVPPFTLAPAPSLAPPGSDGSGRQSRRVLGLASRQFEAAPSGGGVTKGGNRREYAAEKENEEEREPASNSTSSSKREVGGRRKTHRRRALQPGVSSAPARGQTGPTTPVAASSANRRYIGRPGICRP